MGLEVAVGCNDSRLEEAPLKSLLAAQRHVLLVFQVLSRCMNSKRLFGQCPQAAVSNQPPTQQHHRHRPPSLTADTRRRHLTPRMAALLAQLTGGSSAMLHARISTCQADVSRADVNIVHVTRPRAALVDSASAALATRRQLKQAVIIDARRPDAALEHLLSNVPLPELQQQLHADITQAVQLLSATLQQDHARVAVEVVSGQSCPNWHADHVRLRMLCTYAGPGTWFVANRHVRRTVSNAWTGDVAIAAVESRHARQASAGDLLLLKGNGFPGFAGEEMRLLGRLRVFARAWTPHVHINCRAPHTGRRLVLQVPAQCTSRQRWRRESAACC